MNSEAQQQIAVEAALSLDLRSGKFPYDKNVHIILSAIERATADLAKELKLTTTQLAIERHEATQPQRSEQQELAKAFGPNDEGVQIGGLAFMVNVSAELVAYKINAALAANDKQWRERFRKFEKIEEKFGPASQRSEVKEGE